MPFHDKKLTQKWLEFCSEFKPHAIDILGDLLDCYSLSKFDKNPERKKLIKDEVTEATEFLSDLRRAAPRGCKVHLSEGNHEQRIERMLWSKAPGLAGLSCLTIPSLLQLDKFKIEWHKAGEPYQHQGLWFTHGDMVRQQAGATARAISDRMGESIVCGHTHRLGSCTKNLMNKSFCAWECGNLVDVKQAEYVTHPNWQSGFVTIEYPRPHLYCVSAAEVKGTQIIWQGQVL